MVFIGFIGQWSLGWKKRESAIVSAGFLRSWSFLRDEKKPFECEFVLLRVL
jgi:hypothetical protein